MSGHPSRQLGKEIILPILGLIVTILVAYLAYKERIDSTIIPINFTQTAEARVIVFETATLPPSSLTSSPADTASAILTPTLLITPLETTLTSTAMIGKSPGDTNSFYIYPDYSPSGWMGDTRDMKDPVKGPDGVTFEYEACGRGPHEWDNKFFSNGDISPEPAKFAGILYLNPPNNFGTNSEGGFDLREFKSIKWEARSLQGEVHIEFIIGGVNWIWNAQNQKETAPYPDSMPRKSLGIQLLKQEQGWQEFSVSLENKPAKDFQNVVGGFAWVIDWGSNGVVVENPGTCPPQPKVFKIEIRNIRYEK